ncbi:Os07g0289600, partial [Oryza sativa Japonica Group]
QAVDTALRLPPVDLAAQSFTGAEDSELARRLRGPAVAVRERLSFMNEYLAEDRDPVRC